MALAAAFTATTFPIVGIGASAGGLEAFSRLLTRVPADTGMAFIFILHLDPTQESMLPELLGRKSLIPVRQVRDGMHVEPDHAYVIPPNTEMGLIEGRLVLRPRREAANVRAPIDHFFGTLASVRGSQAIGVVLSGTGVDGTRGLALIKGEGGITFAQTPASARHEGMPQSAIAAGCVDLALSPEDIAAQLVSISRHSFIRPDHGPAVAEPVEVGERIVLRRILAALDPATDFSEYRLSTLSRRALRRMAIHRIDTFEAYAARLEEDRVEAQALAEDILIHVTRFFRDPDVFEALEREIFPRMVEQNEPGSLLKIWSVGCATGEETYSIAIALHEFLTARDLNYAVQVFGTDVSESQIVQARAARYPGDLSIDLSAERLQRFFVCENDVWRVRPLIRQTCVFAKHDVARDAPFRALDLVACRNLLIYFEPSLQNRLIPIMHHALKPGGALVLGAAEGIGASSDLFRIHDAKHKIFVRKDVPSRRRFTYRQDRIEPASERPASAPAPKRVAESRSVQRRADEFILRRHAPASIVIDARCDIIHFRGETGPYLAPGTGAPSLNLYRMAREGLHVGLREAIEQARRERVPVRREGLWLRGQQQLRPVRIEVVPIAAFPSDEGHLLVLFEDVAAPAVPPVAGIGPAAPADPDGRLEQADLRLVELEVELEATRTYLQSVIADREASNEDLQAANEEVSSANEELQSFNEELESAKEELQSSSEELATLNDELRHRNDELSSISDNLSNLIEGVAAPIILVDSELRIRRVSGGRDGALQVDTHTVGQRLRDFRTTFDFGRVEDAVRLVVSGGLAREMEVRDHAGRRYSMRVQTYRNSQGLVDGAVMVLMDVEDLERARENLGDIARHLRLTIDSGELGEWDYDFERRTSRRSERHDTIFGHDEPLPEESSARFLDQVHPEDRARVDQAFEEARRIKGSLDIECRILWPDASEHWVWICGSIVPEAGRAVGVVKDITAQKALEEALRSSEVHLRELGTALERRVAERTLELQATNDQLVAFSYSVSHDLRAPLRAMRGYADTLLEEFGVALGGTGRDYLQRIADASTRLDALVRDLLGFSRIAAVEVPAQPVELDSVVKAAIQTLAHQLPSGASIDVVLDSAGRFVVAQEDLLTQVIAHLVDNAVKFAKPAAAPQVRLRSEPRGKFVRLSVEDDGIGIEKVHQERIFGVFERLDNGSRYPGTGIGLAFVRRAIRRMGGETGVESALGKGSRFWIDLPAAPPAPGGGGRSLGV